MSEQNIVNNLKNVHKRIIDAAANSGRNNREIILLAVSKAKSIDDILTAYQFGQRHFGENYVQEALEKIYKLEQYAIIWHFIGRIQSNKAQAIAENFAWVHTVDSVKHAKLLNQYRPKNLPPLNVCIQVNVSNEANKAGVRADELMDLAGQIRQLPQLTLRGLMAIPKFSIYIEEQKASVQALRILADLLIGRGYNMDTLSIGMSKDLEIAVAEGATIVRVGTAIFGKREVNDDSK
ncbi:MAG: YggS family pyridoxal phosphate-dependent enzyme [Legionellales bacterium]|nr:YggS family pyridoxal phosphate-dependent enzyme [Legionellales bacterium]